MKYLKTFLRNSFMHRSLVLASVLVMLPLALTSTVATQDEQPPNLNPGQGQGRGGGRGGGQGRGAPQGPPKPAPRWPDGQINLGQVEGGGTGLWEGGATSLPLATQRRSCAIPRWRITRTLPAVRPSSPATTSAGFSS